MKVKIGDRCYTACNIVPEQFANRLVEVISWEDFKAGRNASTSKTAWRLSEIKKAVFIRYLDGRSGPVTDMVSPNVLQPYKWHRM